MTSKPFQAKQAFVWVWLPNADKPVVAGRIHQQGNLHYFTYGRSYWKRDNAIAFSPGSAAYVTQRFEFAGVE